MISFLYIQTLHNDCSHIEDVPQRCRSRAEFGLVVPKTFKFVIMTDKTVELLFGGPK